MRLRGLIIAIALACISHTSLADLPRHPLSGPPKIARGVVERFLILRKQLFIAPGVGIFSLVAALNGGALVPVSEDRDGIYYQNVHGVWCYDDHYTTWGPELPGIWYRGGLYFSKTKPDDVYAYIGDASKPGAYLQRDSNRVMPSALAQLMIGHVAKGTKKSGR
jgi:hypothetical protein